MRGKRIVDLGVSVRFPNGRGDYAEANTVTVQAPGLDQFNVHSKMHSFVMEAMFSMAKKAADVHGADRARQLAADEEVEAAPVDEPSGALIMDQASIGLGVDRFPEFASYVKKVLTNSKLATIGDDGARITDETWEAIEETAGIDVVMEVLGSFAGFFASARGSRKQSGSASATSSSSPTKVASLPIGSNKRPSRN